MPTLPRLRQARPESELAARLGPIVDLIGSARAELADHVCIGRDKRALTALSQLDQAHEAALAMLAVQP